MSRSFNGTTDEAQSLAGVPGLDSLSYTFACWVKPTTNGEGSTGVMIAAENGTTARGQLRFDPGATGRVTMFDNGTTDAEATTSTALSMGVWSLVLGEFDVATGKCKVWFGDVDTALADQALGTDTTLATKVTGNDRITVGNRDANDRTFDGLIAHVGIWTRKLTSGEKAVLHTGDWPVQGMVRFWPLDALSSRERDLASKSDLTIVGAVGGEAPPAPYTLVPAGGAVVAGSGRLIRSAWTGAGA